MFLPKCLDDIYIAEVESEHPSEVAKEQPNSSHDQTDTEGSNDYSNENKDRVKQDYIFFADEVPEQRKEHNRYHDSWIHQCLDQIHCIHPWGTPVVSEFVNQRCYEGLGNKLLALGRRQTTNVIIAICSRWQISTQTVVGVLIVDKGSNEHYSPEDDSQDAPYYKNADLVLPKRSYSLHQVVKYLVFRSLYWLYLFGY